MQRSTEYLTRRSTATLEEGIADSTDNVGTTAETFCSKIMNICRSTFGWPLLVDSLFASSVLTLIALLEFGVIAQQSAGFFCNDPKISFKFQGDTISIGLLLSGSILLPLVVMWTVEYTCHDFGSYNAALGYAGSRVKQVLIWYGHYSVGFVSLVLICDMMKVFVGEPRPHFLDTCKPREAINCTGQYIRSFTCTNTVDSEWFVSDSSRSFPSGHSALSVYTTVYIVCYFESRLPRRTLFLKPWLQCVMGLWAVTCSLTRIGDNRHHWWDVLAGDALGFLISACVVLVACRKFTAIKLNTCQALPNRIENGQVSSINEKDQSIRKLFSRPSVDIPEGRELGDIAASWKE